MNTRTKIIYKSKSKPFSRRARGVAENLKSRIKVFGVNPRNSLSVVILRVSWRPLRPERAKRTGERTTFSV